MYSAYSDKDNSKQEVFVKGIMLFESSNVVVEININGTEKSKCLFLQRCHELRPRACEGNVQ